MISYHQNERLTFAEFREFLTRTDLGSQYPKERFEERATALLQNRSVAVTARGESGELVGLAFGLTDFVYFLFVTDLGVDRRFARQGIGRKLLEHLHQAAGGADDINVVTVANTHAIPFYEKCGFENPRYLFWKQCRVWGAHTVA